MRRGVILFFLVVACACAGDVAPWAPFPLDATNTIYDRRILTNLVEAVNERCAVVTNIEALDHADFTGFVTRAKLELIDAKIVELAPHFIDRSMTNTVNNSAVYNGWFRKYNAGLDVYNFVLASDVTQGLPRLNMPQAFKQAEVGTNIWPLTNWWGIITNCPPYQTEEDRVTTYLCRPEWTVVPGRPIVATIAEWRARYIQKPGDPSAEWQWIDGRLNTIDGDPMNWTNWYGGTLPDRPYPFQGRLYEWDGSLPFAEWISTNTDAMPPAPGFVQGTAYQNDGGGDMYRQGILTNEGLSGNFEVTWPARGNGPAQMTNMHMRVKSDAAGQLGLPANPIEGDVLRIWYAVTNPPMYTYSGEEPYSGTTRTWANILWRECLNERYRIINAMRWTTPETSGGEWGWYCTTAFVYQCEMAAQWPEVTADFPIEVFTAGTNLPCPPPVTPYTPPNYGVFPGWIERTGTVFAVTNDCGLPDNIGSNQPPKTIYAVGGSNSYASRYYIANNIATNIEIDGAVGETLLVRWTINRLIIDVTGDATAVVDYAISAPYATITNAISNLAYAVDFYMFGSNSVLAGMDDPEFLPLQTQSVTMAADRWAATGQPVEASSLFNWQFPAAATSSIRTSCGMEVIGDIGTNAITSIIVRAASYLCDTQQVQVTNFTFDGWTYKSNFINDVPDAGRTNRFETRYYWVAYDPETDWETTTNAEACYWRVTNFVWSTDPNIGICGTFESDDPEPIFSAVDIVTVASNGLEPWDDLAAIVGFYPTGETRIVDGYTNNAGEPQGDLYLTISAYDPLIPGSITYSNDLIYSYFWQTPVYSNTVPELYAQHSQTNRCVYDPPFGDSIKWFAYEGRYEASVALSNSVTNAWIMQWEPVIRWDVVGGFQYVD